MKVRVIALGQLLRGDDCVALELIDRFPKFRYPGVEFVNVYDNVLGIMDGFREAEGVLLVDCFAARPLDPPVIRRDLHDEPLYVERSTSSHGLDLAMVVELARKLCLLPRHVCLIAIAGYRFGTGERPSPGLEQRLRLAEDRLVAELDQFSRTV